jgi:hypothetical protein
MQPGGRIRSALRLLIGALLALTAGVASAQEDVCTQLLVEYQRLGPPRTGASPGDLQAAMEASRQYGCNRPFIFVRPSPICVQIRADIERLRRGVGDPTEGVRRAILRDMQSYGCPPPSAGQRVSGFQTMCVRTCDGFFFPISSRANKSDFKQHAMACQALCPGAEAALYYRPAGSEDLKQARSVDGNKPYADLPNAFAYQRSYVSGCSCAPRGGWSTVADLYRALYPEKMGAQFSTAENAVAEDPAAPTEDDTPNQTASAPTVTAATRTPDDKMRLIGPAYYFAH